MAEAYGVNSRAVWERVKPHFSANRKMAYKEAQQFKANINLNNPPHDLRYCDGPNKEDLLVQIILN